MYAALWRVLPGPTWLRLLLLLLLAFAVVLVCFEWVFPLIARAMPLNEQTVGMADVTTRAGT